LKEDKAAGRPWYREIWPWLLMVPPALAVAGGLAMIYLATQTPSALVVDDYARIEELTSERFARDREARRLDLSAELSFENGTGRIEVTLEAPALGELPSALTLALRHATDPSADRDLSLARRGERFVADAELAPGRYLLELMPADRTWRLGTGARRLAGRVVLRPQSDGV
jgi:hypothetical protein